MKPVQIIGVYASPTLQWDVPERRSKQVHA